MTISTQLASFQESNHFIRIQSVKTRNFHSYLSFKNLIFLPSIICIHIFLVCSLFIWDSLGPFIVDWVVFVFFHSYLKWFCSFFNMYFCGVFRVLRHLWFSLTSYHIFLFRSLSKLLISCAVNTYCSISDKTHIDYGLNEKLSYISQYFGWSSRDV